MKTTECQMKMKKVFKLFLKTLVSEMVCGMFIKLQGICSSNKVSMHALSQL